MRAGKNWPRHVFPCGTCYNKTPLKGHAHTAKQYIYHANLCCSHIAITGVGYYLYNRRNVPNTTRPVAGIGTIESNAQCSETRTLTQEQLLVYWYCVPVYIPSKMKSETLACMQGHNNLRDGSLWCPYPKMAENDETLE